MSGIRIRALQANNIQLVRASLKMPPLVVHDAPNQSAPSLHSLTFVTRPLLALMFGTTFVATVNPEVRTCDQAKVVRSIFHGVPTNRRFPICDNSSSCMRHRCVGSRRISFSFHIHQGTFCIGAPTPPKAAMVGTGITLLITQVRQQTH